MVSSTGPKSRRNIWGYLDETGSLRGNVSRGGSVFGMGLLISPRPHELHKRICDLRSSLRYNKEFKFEHVDARSLPVYKKLLDTFFGAANARFSAELYTRTNIETSELSAPDISKLYNRLAFRLICNSLDKGNYEGSDYIAVIADDISTRIDDMFEAEIRERLRRKLRRGALFGMSRAESHAFTELQLCDVLLGTVAYSFKLEHSLLSSRPQQAREDLVKHLQKLVHKDSLATSFVSALKYGQRFEVRDRTSEKVIT